MASRSGGRPRPTVLPVALSLPKLILLVALALALLTAAAFATSQLLLNRETTRSTIQRHVTRRRNEPHALNCATLVNHKLNLKFALLKEGRARLFWNEVVPVPAHILEYTGEIWTKVYA